VRNIDYAWSWIRSKLVDPLGNGKGKVTERDVRNWSSSGDVRHEGAVVSWLGGIEIIRNAAQGAGAHRRLIYHLSS